MTMNVIDRLSRVGKAGTVVGTLLLTLAVGVVDVWTGSDVRLLSLYLLAVAWCGWRLGRRGVLFAVLVTLSTWGVSQQLSGVQHWSAGVWVFNLVSQSVALLSIGWLVAELSRRLEAERATARIDPLSGLRNRRALAQDSELALAICHRHAHPVALAFIDLDDFKQVNDRLGHEGGDTVIQACARALTASCRATDLPARLGGDEFVILMPETTAPQAQALMERVRLAFAQAVAGLPASAGMTVGVLAEAQATRTLDRLLAEADALMYEAKREGKGRVFVRVPEPASIIGANPPDAS